jgi:hypothetical protein
MIASPKQNGAQAERIRKLFSEWIEPGEYTRLFEELPRDQQEGLLTGAGLEPDEQPLVACVLDEACWTLLTSQRLIWSLAGHQTALAWDALADVQLLHRMSRLRHAHEIVTASVLQVITHDGRAHALELETGPPFFGFWTALKLIINAHRRAGGG